MARKRRKKAEEGPRVRFLMSCRRGIHVDQRVGVDEEGDKYIDRTILEHYEASPAEVPRTDGFSATEEVECPSCGRRVKIEVAGPTLAALRQFGAALVILLVTPFLVIPCLYIPEVLRLSEKAAGDPYAFARYALIGMAVILLAAVLLGLASHSSIDHVLRTRDHKHTILPPGGWGEEDDD